ncbi:RNA-binding protein [Hydrogenispora ethanolica]|uniref:YlmH family RNA-binding protein n=1 Tax=Hydrogenispora ethanolica TaxID=1082276 RepID=UPI001A9D5593|nr:YlmH/Sll1252 family protein [Hydrogenispora ethanolica]
MDPTNEEKLLLTQITELAERSLHEQQPLWTDFLDPSQLEQVKAVLAWNNGVRFRVFGGYSKAERQRLVVYPDYYIAEAIEPALGYLQIVSNSPEELTHRDFLGSILALGLKREKIGDLLVTGSVCQVILVPELVPFILSHLERVGNSRVKTAEIEPEQLNLPDIREKEIRTTVASLRLDALAALGFGESRTKMAREIRAERLKVNWKPVKNPDQLVSPGDVISMRGRGRVVFREQTGTSKKGRLGVVLVRQL